ncbi:hypothetical protein [Priestia megaterium]|uniref:hypothetical protein n=1 Tax=Priestia megaterium TaxID=1404 RepID=UPI0011B4F8DC|nr:hypothetical protein [Priestia megaterium]QDZ88699.1 hypothetical protein D0441_31165 [Priestia megaterium]
MAAKQDKTESLARSILEHFSTMDGLNERTENVLNKVGNLNYHKQQHQLELYKIESQLQTQQALLEALSLAKLMLLDKEGKEK